MLSHTAMLSCHHAGGRPSGTGPAAAQPGDVCAPGTGAPGDPVVVNLSFPCSLGLGRALQMQQARGGEGSLGLGDSSQCPGMWPGGPCSLARDTVQQASPPCTHSPGWRGGGRGQRPHSGASARFPGQVGWVSSLLQMKRFPNWFPLP